MKLLHTCRLAVLALCALHLSGCAHYSTAKERRPRYAASRDPISQIITGALGGDMRRPEVVLGGYLDAVHAATEVLRVDPGNADARRDYNFAVSRIVELVNDTRLRPWAAPIRGIGKNGDWEFTFPPPKSPEHNPDNFRFLPSDRYEFKGTYVTTRTLKDGLGAPIVVTSTEEDYTRLDPFAQGKRLYYGLTGIVRFEGRRAVMSVADPLSEETVKVTGRTFPLAADFTAPLALALARENPRKLEILRVLRPQRYAETARLARLQPYDPKKIPVICVHGLMDSPATWTPIINTLRGEKDIRDRYQFWFYSYPSGYPYPYSASIMRDQLDAIGARYPDRKKVVLLGHSMGSLISRTMVTDSGMHLWNQFLKRPPETIGLSRSSRKILTGSLIFRPRPEVARVIFISGPHRGADLATNWIGRTASRLINAPATLMSVLHETTELLTLNGTPINWKRMPNSIDTLSPDNGFVKAINKLPIQPGVPYHSIMGDRGKGGNKDRTPPVSTDGVVPYWSSHLDGAQSELIVPSGHGAHQNPEAIAEVARILRLHAGLPQKSSSTAPAPRVGAR